MTQQDVTVDLDEHIGTVEIHRPPNNFFDHDLIKSLANIYLELDADPDCRAIVLCSEGKHFCAGADLESKQPGGAFQHEHTKALYDNALRLFRGIKPVVAAVQGSAIGGGLGLALSSDFRVTCTEARFCANFARLGFHQGFALSVTLPRLIGHADAELMLLTGRRIDGKEAVRIGLADELVPHGKVRERACRLAAEIAQAAPLAVQSIRRTLRNDLADEVAAVLAHELDEQMRLSQTQDFREGVDAMSERRSPTFKGE